MTTPLAVSTDVGMPDDVRPALPSAADLAAIVNDARHATISPPPGAWRIAIAQQPAGQLAGVT